MLFLVFGLVALLLFSGCVQNILAPTSPTINGVFYKNIVVKSIPYDDKYKKVVVELDMLNVGNKRVPQAYNYYKIEVDKGYIYDPILPERTFLETAYSLLPQPTSLLPEEQKH